jgi:hypothetical protein
VAKCCPQGIENWADNVGDGGDPMPDAISQKGRITKLEGGFEGKMTTVPPRNPTYCVSRTAKAKS